MRDRLFATFGDIIVRGYTPQDPAFGSNARSIDFESKYAQGTGVYDVVTQQLLGLFVRDSLGRGHRYAWVAKHVVDYDNQLYSITEELDDIFEKAIALLGNRRFDPKVVMQFDLDPETTSVLETLAVSRNETLDDTIQYVLVQAIEATNG